MPDALRELLVHHVRQGTMPGAVATMGRTYDPIAVGLAAPGGAALAVDSIFRIQSMTKLVTAVATLRLVHDGVLSLDDPVAGWLPELRALNVLPHPDAPLAEARPATHPITVRHLLTNQSGYGAATTDSPWGHAMSAAGVEAGPEPVDLDAQTWLEALASVPLAFEPGTGWRYHHSFGLLGILLGRVTDGTTLDVLRATVFDPAGMTDTGFVVPRTEAHRLPAAFRREPDRFVETEPAGAGFSVEPAPFDVSHSELVSTLADYHAFLTALIGGQLIEPAAVDELRRDQIDESAKAPESFYPGFWDHAGWGYGVSVVTDGPHRGRFGWSGGLGTDFFVDPDGTIGILLMQVELDDPILALYDEFQNLG